MPVAHVLKANQPVQGDTYLFVTKLNSDIENYHLQSRGKRTRSHPTSYGFQTLQKHIISHLVLIGEAKF